MTKSNMERFYEAHRRDFEKALSEIRNGYKESHWMWYIFPQIRGLGRSFASEHYAIADMSEAVDFLNDSYLGGNLRMICEELLKCKTSDPVKIFGGIDAKKLRSCMTLFDCAGGGTEENRVFYDVLLRFFNGRHDDKTLRIIESMKKE